MGVRRGAGAREVGGGEEEIKACSVATATTGAGIAQWLEHRTRD